MSSGRHKNGGTNSLPIGRQVDASTLHNETRLLREAVAIVAALGRTVRAITLPWDDEPEKMPLTRTEAKALHSTTVSAILCSEARNSSPYFMIMVLPPCRLNLAATMTARAAEAARR
jgi:hypothetical protein